MPNYEYQCKECGHRFEDIQTIANRDLPLASPCPHCHAAKSVERGWLTPPTMGTDAAVKPTKGFKERMENMKSKLGRYNPQVRSNIDRALDMKGSKYGAQ